MDDDLNIVAEHPLQLCAEAVPESTHLWGWVYITPLPVTELSKPMSVKVGAGKTPRVMKAYTMLCHILSRF